MGIESNKWVECIQPLRVQNATHTRRGRIHSAHYYENAHLFDFTKIYAIGQNNER